MAQSQPQITTQIRNIGNLNLIVRASDHYVNATALCSSAGRKVSKWKANDRTIDFLAEFVEDMYRNLYSPENQGFLAKLMTSLNRDRNSREMPLELGQSPSVQIRTDKNQAEMCVSSDDDVQTNVGKIPSENDDDEHEPIITTNPATEIILQGRPYKIADVKARINDISTEYECLGNDNRATWVHPYIAIHIAHWASPVFAVQVSRWIESLLNNGAVYLQQEEINSLFGRLATKEQELVAVNGELISVRGQLKEVERDFKGLEIELKTRVGQLIELGENSSELNGRLIQTTDTLAKTNDRLVSAQEKLAEKAPRVVPIVQDQLSHNLVVVRAIHGRCYIVSHHQKRATTSFLKKHSGKHWIFRNVSCGLKFINILREACGIKLYMFRSNLYIKYVGEEDNQVLVDAGSFTQPKIPYMTEKELITKIKYIIYSEMTDEETEEHEGNEDDE